MASAVDDLKANVAAIDVGSHTLRLLIAELRNRTELKPLRVERAITRLASNFQRDRRLAAASRQQSIDVLAAYRGLLHQYGVRRVACGATGVLRRADNAAEFLQAVEAQTGLSVPVLSEHSEAVLSAKGVLSVLPDTPKTMVSFDLGGSSTEFLFIDPGQAEPVWGTSVFIGAATLTERYLLDDPPSAASVQAAAAAVRNEIAPVMAQVRASLDGFGVAPRDLVLVGTAGTVTTLAAMHLQMAEYEPYRVNGLPLDKMWLATAVKRLAPLPIAARRGIPGLEKGREDIILGGALIVLEILNGLQQERFTVTDAGLLEGILLDLVERQYDLPQTLRTPLTWHWQKR